MNLEARLLASKLSQDTSMVIPNKLNMSTTVHEETLIEEPPPISSTIPENHVTLRDVSVIEKEIEMDHNLPNPELSVSLLPCIPTASIPDEDPMNKSIASTISDKTFVKKSLRPFSSDEESDEDDDDDDNDEDTIIEESFSTNKTENIRPLLLTADRSIRRPPSKVLPTLIKQEKVSFHEPLAAKENHSLLNNNDKFDVEKSESIRSTIINTHHTSKLPTILSDEP